MLAQRWQERYGGGSAEPRPELPPGGFLPPAGAGPASFEAPVYVPPAPGGGFRSPRMSAIMLALAGVLALAALAVDLVWLDKIGAEGASYDTVMDLARVMDALSVLQLVSVLAAAAAFIVWLYRAYGNLPILGIVKPRHARGWAIGAWFVPLANLVIPKQIANDVWRAGDPELAPGRARLEEAPGRGAGPLVVGRLPGGGGADPDRREHARQRRGLRGGARRRDRRRDRPGTDDRRRARRHLGDPALDRASGGARERAARRGCPARLGLASGPSAGCRGLPGGL
jgi:hypothetical protein